MTFRPFWRTNSWPRRPKTRILQNKEWPFDHFDGQTSGLGKQNQRFFAKQERHSDHLEKKNGIKSNDAAKRQWHPSYFWWTNPRPRYTKTKILKKKKKWNADDFGFLRNPFLQKKEMTKTKSCYILTSLSDHARSVIHTPTRPRRPSPLLLQGHADRDAAGAQLPPEDSRQGARRACG